MILKMSTSNAEDFVSYARPIIDQSPQMNEETTKARIIQPLSERLGWDIKTDIELEYSIPMHGRQHSVDYALMLEEKPSVFVEAKGCDTTLDDDHGEQLETYMKQHNVNWGLLTNGKSYRVMFRQTEDGDVYVVPLGSFSLEDFPDRGNLWRTLSKESISEGEANEIAEHIQEINRTINDLTRRKDDIADEVTKIVTSHVGDASSNIVESEAKSFVDSLVQSLKEETGEKIPTSDKSSQVVGITGGFWAEIERELGIKKEGDRVRLPEVQPANESYTEFVDYLVREGYIRDSDIPIESGPTRFVLNTEPVDRKGRDMHNPKRIRDDLFLETHLSVEDIRRRILDLGQEFGLD